MTCPDHNAPTPAPKESLFTTMRQIDILLQIDHLHRLGDNFTAQQQAVQRVEPEPGTELLRHLSPILPAVHDLVTQSLTRLTVLDGSQYTAAPGARAALDALSSLVATASNAATTLANTLGSNPLDTAESPDRSTADEGAAVQVRHDEARQMIAQGVADAALQLEVCAATCHATATGIMDDLIQSPEHRPPLPNLTAAQYTALEKIADGGASRYTSIRGGAARITATDGTTLHATPFAVLEKHRLIDTARTPAATGQRIHITAAGRLALTVQKPTRARPPAPATAPVLAHGHRPGTHR
ncbi:hypothetical protein RM572_27780 [Streptomyces sp. DSM 42041]|uniref:DUF222 domain-containing protein n=1 Tax=Streptomyces hazeniae TaxID=3075538 RepID=A0ABU2P3T4_9ACTN|nr:hypothetical protein [Streptomyces sp. DSM 42041]MDT0382563.1 hypothetical protein [Streptomyces sp. DSM 42041]